MNKVNRFHEEGADPLLVEKFDKANKEFLNGENSFSDIKVEAYLYLKRGDWGANWRVRLIDLGSGVIIADSLDPMIVDAHTCYLIVVSAYENYKRGITEGIERAADAQAKAVIKAIYENSDTFPRDPVHKEIVNGRVSIRGIINLNKEE